MPMTWRIQSAIYTPGVVSETIFKIETRPPPPRSLYWLKPVPAVRFCCV